MLWVAKRTLVVLVIAALMAGCAVRQHLKRGDQALKDGNFNDAIAAYEEALRVAPGHTGAHERIRRARRFAVRDRLEIADQALSAGKLASALRYAMQARRMPLDLEDVNLVRRIDATVDKAAQLAKNRVRDYVDRGHFLNAVGLSQHIVDASPGVESREVWAGKVRQLAIGHYTSLAEELSGSKLAGSAAIQLAMARKVGAEVKVGDVQALWNRFAEPTCFAEPKVKVVDKSGKARELGAKIETTARTELQKLRDQCGDGNRPIGVTIQLTKVDLRDDTSKQTAAKPLPGVEIKTEEIYYEEETYTVIEEVTEYEIQIKKEERRDCAPRPGKPRGCHKWIKEVEVKVPKKVKKEVEKIRRIEKTRPIKEPLPPDKVLSYEVTTVKRRVSYQGTIEITGEVKVKRPFEVERISNDTSNAEARTEGMVIPADPLEAKSMTTLVAEAAESVAEDVRKAVADGVSVWAQRYQKEAEKRVLGGQMPQAEELYLKLLALGAEGGDGMRKFFNDRYGRRVEKVMDLLASALGRSVPKRVATGADSAAKARFPTRGPSRDQVVVPDPAMPTAPTAPVVEKTSTGPDEPGTDATSGFSEDELADLEKASMDALESKEKPESGGAEKKPETKKKDPSIEEEPPSGRRPVPIKPKEEGP